MGVCHLEIDLSIWFFLWAPFTQTAALVWLIRPLPSNLSPSAARVCTDSTDGTNQLLRGVTEPCEKCETTGFMWCCRSRSKAFQTCRIFYTSDIDPIVPLQCIKVKHSLSMHFKNSLKCTYSYLLNLKYLILLPQRVQILCFSVSIPETGSRLFTARTKEHGDWSRCYYTAGVSAQCS